MKHKFIVVTGWTLAIVKVLLALGMMYAGFYTCYHIPLDPDLGFLYSNKWTMCGMGVIFFASGLILFLGKVLRRRAWTGIGLMATSMCFLFSALLNMAAHGFGPEVWLGNFIVAVLVAGLWLWWKYKIRLAEYRELYDLAKRRGIR